MDDEGERIDTSCDSNNSTLETYYSNFIARQLYEQNCLKYGKSQYWLTVRVSRGVLEQHTVATLGPQSTDTFAHPKLIPDCSLATRRSGTCGTSFLLYEQQIVQSNHIIILF